jgi:hypothetical protein
MMSLLYIRDVILDKMGGMCPSRDLPAARSRPKAPRAARQYAVVTSAGQRGAIGEYKLDLLVAFAQVERLTEV